jgi:hypothetical protein
MAGPWEKYQTEPTESTPGPWNKYEEKTPQSWSQELGITNPVARVGVDLAEGAASGLASTVFRGGDAIRRLFGMERVIDRPEVKQSMAAPETTPGKAGKFIEQAAEFAIPGGAISNATRGAALLVRMGAQALGAGSVAALQSGADPGATAAGAVAGAAGPAIGAGLQSAAGRFTPRLYQSALKPTWSMAKKEGAQMVETGMKEGVPVSKTGLELVERKIGDLRAQISQGITDRAAQGKTVDSSKVLSTLDDLENFYKNTAAPKESLDTIQGIRDEFTSYHGQQIPIDKAQQIKINTYQLIKKSYGEMKSAKIEGLKQTARGLKEEISTVFPEIAGMNEQQSRLLGLDEALTRAVWRIENHQMMGIGSGIAASAGGAMLGGPGAVASFVGKLVLDDPNIKSRLAIALARAGVKDASKTVSTRMLALKGAINEVAARIAETHESPSLQPSPVAIQ